MSDKDMNDVGETTSADNDTAELNATDVAVDEATASPSEHTIPFVGEWRRLISTTNWDKGRIVFLWREALQDSGAPANEYSDEEWSLIVGGVTPQHVGRLRRVYGRFHEVHDEYQGLYWSHFCSAVDWEDAEMWLEGAIQNSWSVAKMRKQRWETIGSPPDEEPQDSDIVESEPEVEQQLDDHSIDGEEVPSQRLDDGKVELVSPNNDGDDTESSMAVFSEEDKPQAPVRPFAQLAKLPEDMATAFEDFKLSILQHKMDDWKEIAQEDVLATLDSLRALALAPS